jgi:hypothetical protein
MLKCSVTPPAVIDMVPEQSAFKLVPVAWTVRLIRGLGAPAEVMARARNAAVKALQIDDSVATAHTTLGVVHAHFE